MLLLASQCFFRRLLPQARTTSAATLLPRLRRLYGSQPGNTRPISTSVTWVPSYEQAPTAVGVLDIGDIFHEIIPTGSLLPVRRKLRFENALDFATSMRLGVAQKSAFHSAIPVAELELHRTRCGKQGECQVDVTLSLEQDLSGTAEAYDIFTQSKIQISYQLSSLLEDNRKLLQRAE